MRFSIFQGNTQVKNMRVKNKAFFRYFKRFYLVVLFCIKNMFAVSG
jgi:hypothetical protein